MTVSAERILRDPSSVDTPQLIVSEEILHRNIAEMAAFAKSINVQLRPHIKTHKSIEIARLQMAAGAVGITCAKVGEAEVMVNEGGIDDVLLAYPIVGAKKYERIVKLMEKSRIAVVVDSATAIEMIAQAMTRHERVIDIYLEINTGQNRSGVMWGDEAVRFAQDIDRHPNLRLAGIMTHEGHVAAFDPDEISKQAIAAGEKMVQTAEMIRSHSINLPTVSVGSTPAARMTPTVAGVTEMRPGTYVFNDSSLFRFGDQWGVEDCAARFVATVVSRAAADRCVLDAGSKTLALDPNAGHKGYGYIVGHPDVIIDRLSEEHGACVLPEGEEGFEIGDTVEVIPNHICPTINLMDRMAVVRDGEVVDYWQVAARGRVQ
ncbi:MAG: alanine racemase [Thermomicrobiales bacterium]|nr:alanine racemase [Thermomicrobiales bacterium]MCO5224869.1 alanine racemase [Thermomicrobiales bacterium]MCO5228953.1 alanine racemase [Thermomicrobiales bacterium]